MGEEHKQDDEKLKYITTTNLYILFHDTFLLHFKLFLI